MSLGDTVDVSLYSAVLGFVSTDSIQINENIFEKVQTGSLFFANNKSVLKSQGKS